MTDNGQKLTLAFGLGELKKYTAKLYYDDDDLLRYDDASLYYDDTSLYAMMIIHYVMTIHPYVMLIIFLYML